MTDIDNLDRSIIELLQEDGSLTNAGIASLLNTSEATVRRRKSFLKKEDVYRLVAVVDPFKIGFKVMAIVGLQVEKLHLRNIEQALVEMNEVRFLGITLGTYDMVFEAWFQFNDEFLHFITVRLAEVEGIIRTETFQIMRLSKYTYDWGTPNAAKLSMNVAQDLEKSGMGEDGG
ncbi:Lrp/AsnC family transcriptional regulator [Chloroflexota bacterium]